MTMNFIECPTCQITSIGTPKLYTALRIRYGRPRTRSITCVFINNLPVSMVVIRGKAPNYHIIIIWLSLENFHIFVLVYRYALHFGNPVILIIIRFSPSMKWSIVCKSSLCPPPRSTGIAQYRLLRRPIAPKRSAYYNTWLLAIIHIK